MRSTILVAAGVMGIIALASATRAHAAFPTFHLDEGAFDAAGTIVQSTNASAAARSLSRRPGR